MSRPLARERRAARTRANMVGTQSPARLQQSTYSPMEDRSYREKRREAGYARVFDEEPYITCSASEATTPTGDLG